MRDLLVSELVSVVGLAHIPAVPTISGDRQPLPASLSPDVSAARVCWFISRKNLVALGCSHPKFHTMQGRKLALPVSSFLAGLKQRAACLTCFWSLQLSEMSFLALPVGLVDCFDFSDLAHFFFFFLQRFVPRFKVQPAISFSRCLLQSPAPEFLPLVLAVGSRLHKAFPLLQCPGSPGTGTLASSWLIVASSASLPRSHLCLLVPISLNK